MNMEVWADDILSEDNSDYEIMSDTDSIPSLEDGIDNVIDEEEFIQHIRDISHNRTLRTPSPNSIGGIFDNSNNVVLEDGEIQEDFSDEAIFGMENLRIRIPQTPQNSMNYAIPRWSNLTPHRHPPIPRLQLRNIQRNILIDIDVQDCLDTVIRTIEIDYETPFAIKCQKFIRGYLAKKKLQYLKKVAEESKKTKTCSVCYNDLNVLNMSVTPCGHYYCSECLFRWMNEKNTCAMCRQELYVPKIDVHTLRRDTRRAVRYHANLQRRILDMEMNKMRLETETNKIVRKSNQSLARQIRLRGMLAETKKMLNDEADALDSVYDEYLELIDDCKTDFNVKIKLEKHLSEKLEKHIQTHSDNKKIINNRKRIAEKIMYRENKNKMRKTNNINSRYSFQTLNFTIEQLRDNTDYESFATFWIYISNTVTEENEDELFEIVDEVIV